MDLRNHVEERDLPNGTAALEPDSSTSMPTRRIVASYDNYIEAQRAVDYLSDEKFPVHRVAIVAEGLRFEEQITGRLHWGTAALNGAVSGAIPGALVGFFFGMFNWITPLVSAFSLALYGFLFGSIVGALMGILALAMSGGKRNFMSVGGIRASHYLVMVDEETADLATRMLANLHTPPRRDVQVSTRTPEAV